MKIFISWSGVPAQLCAEALHDWLPFMNSGIEPFVSSKDIFKGDRPMQELAAHLENAHFGIVCLTRENHWKPWINFEAGALSKHVSDSAVFPFLLDMPMQELHGPLGKFQATDSSLREDVLKLVRSINRKCARPVGERQLERLFGTFWGELDEKLCAIRKTSAEEVRPVVRDPAEALDELIGLVRDQTTRITALEERLKALTEVPVIAPRESEEDLPSSAPVAEHSPVTYAAEDVYRIVGRTHVTHTDAQKDGIAVVCDGEGFKRAGEMDERLQRLATWSRIPIRISYGEQSVVFFPS